MRRVLVVAISAAALLALPSVAFARPFVDTQIEWFSETFSDEPVLCQEELYAQTVTGMGITHVTIRVDDEGNFVPPLRFHQILHATVVSVPLDGTGPTFVGHFHIADLETIRSVKHGEVIAETDTDQNRFRAKGSDGSRVWIRETHHFTFNANGEVSVEFEKVAMSC